jgi:serine/threonine-protein kinase RsbT
MPSSTPEPGRGSVVVEIASNEDVVIVRQRARELCQRVGLSLLETTKVVTAASELARNTLEHGGGGRAELDVLVEGSRRGLRMVFVDDGPGIADLEQALTDGFTTGKGLGLGLGGSRRLVGNFHIESEVGRGTRVQVIQWK